MKGLTVVVLLLMLVPHADARAVEGVLTVRGSVDILSPATLAGPPLAVFVADSSHLGVLTLYAPRVVVHAYSKEYTDAGAAGLRPRIATSTQGATYELTDVSVSLAAGDSSGWMGLRATTGRLDGSADGSVRLERKDTDALGNGKGGPTPGRDQPVFVATLDTPHLRSEGVSSLQYQGGGELKLAGPDLMIRAHENSTRLWTGMERGEGAVPTVRIAWVTFEFASAEFELQGARDAVVALSRAQVAWDGEAALGQTYGALRSGSDVLTAQGQEARVVGDFSARVEPSAAGALTVAVDGDLRSASLPSTPKTSPYVDLTDGSGWFLLLAVAAGLGGTATWAIMRRRKAPFSAEECVQLANGAATEGDFALALGWIKKARVVAPSSGRLLLEEGYYLSHLGDDEAALAAFDAAATTMDSGEPELYAARLLAARGRDMERATSLLATALTRSPILVLEVEGDDAFGQMVSWPRAREAMEDARRRLERADGSLR